MGTWCGAGMSVQFASGNWTFTLPGGNRASYAVSAYTPGANSVTMSWTDDQRRKMQTQFGQFSEDGRSMVQLRGREQGSDDWHEYNRRFTRCG